MHYILDGYNLIGCSDKFSLSEENKEASLAQYLLPLATAKRDKLSLVFDNKSTAHTWASQQKTGPVTSIFTDQAESADDYIIRKIQGCKNTQALCVVTSDRVIIRAAKHAKIRCLSSHDFLATYTLPHLGASSDKPMHRPSEPEIQRWLDVFGE